MYTLAIFYKYETRIMYIPKHNLGKENKEAIAFINRFTFGIIIST